MSLNPIELTRELMTFRDAVTGLEIGLAGPTLTPNGVKGTVTFYQNGSRIGRDTLLLSMREKRRRLAKEIAAAAGLEEDGQVETLLLDLEDFATEWLQGAGDEARADAPLTEEEEVVALALLHHPQLWQKIDAAIDAQGVTGEKMARKLIYLLFTSHLLPKPMSAAVKGPSASGKSFIVEAIRRLFPPSVYYMLTSASERALIYTKADFRHRILIILEAHESPFLEMLVRTLLSEGKIIYETVIDQEAVLLEKEGPTGLVVTTTQATLHEENETRVLSIFIRDDPAQTTAVMKEAALRFSVNGTQTNSNVSAFIAMQHWLRQSGDRDVVVPFAGALVGLLPDKPVRWRRDVTQILTAIQTCALLHQRQRGRDGEGRVLATLDDYEMVRPLLDMALAPSLADNLTETQRAAVKAVGELTGTGGSVTITAVARHLNIDRTSAASRLRSALEGGYVVNEEVHPNRPAKLCPGKETMPPPRVLPSLEEVKNAYFSQPPEKPLPASPPAIYVDTAFDSPPDSPPDSTPTPVLAHSPPDSPPESLSDSDRTLPLGGEAGSRFRESDETEAADRARRLRARALWKELGSPATLALDGWKKIVNPEKFIANASADELEKLIAELEKS